VAVEVLIGHGVCHAIIETSAPLETLPIEAAIRRIAGSVVTDVVIVPQDNYLAQNQESAIRCGDNGIFKGVPVTDEQERLVSIAHAIYDQYPYDGKYILDGKQLVICQSNAISDTLRFQYPGATVNPLGDWTGGLDVDTGATNRKLGSDMADSVTGGGLHGKDLSKADVSVNIYAWLEAQRTGQPVEFCCAIGDELVGGVPYTEIVETARAFIKSVGGFEKFAEWGLV
jgi:S-adenosylmethionine synthetase